MFDFRSIAKELADWLISNNVVEHIFGPNLHIEVCGELLDFSALLREEYFRKLVIISFSFPDYQTVPSDFELLGSRGEVEYSAY